MLDVFVITEEGELQLVQRLTAPVKDFVTVVRDKTLAALARVDSTGIRLPTADEHAVAGFFASENAKSELLLLLAPVDVNDDALRAARDRLLDAEVRRSHAVNLQRDPTTLDSAVATARRTYLSERRRYPRFGSDESESDYRLAIADLAGEMTGEGRVLVHYNIYEGRVVAFWVAESGRTRGWIEGDAVDVKTLREATQPWLEHPHGDVEALLSAGAGLASELHEALVGVNAREVVIAPTSVLHAVPWAALPLNGRTFGDTYRVSYTPSFEILRRLCTDARRERDGIALIGSEDGWLPWADAEIAAATALSDLPTVVPGDASHDRLIEAINARRIIHIAAHGISRANDHFGSAVKLHNRETPDAYLTAAEVHRDSDMRGAELVLLSICDSGRGGTLRSGIEFYTGLDGAFLAQGARAVVSTLWPVKDFASFLFMTNLHVRLRTGETVAASFEHSVRFLRDGHYQRVPQDSDVSRALDHGSPIWRRKISEVGAAFTHPYAWAPFRLSGAHWISRPYVSFRE
jgi:hypothetical protein